MRLIWSRPTDDIGIERYVIYRSANASSPGDSLSGTVDTTYLDMDVAGDVGVHYFYTVRAVDLVGNKSSESNMVGEFDRPLYSTNR
jgi:fibronectin type 3 domain-containing protein